MFQFRNLNSDPHSNVMSDFLMCIRNHSDNLSTICRSHNQLTSITNDLMGYYFSERSVIRQYRSLNEMQQEMRLPVRSTSTSTSTSTTTRNQDISSNIFSPPPPPPPINNSNRTFRSSYNPPPPRMPPPPPPQETATTTWRNSRTRRARRRSTTLNSIMRNPSFTRTFINNTLWTHNPISNPASIKNVIDNTTLYTWKDIKDNHDTNERCPIDLSVLQDDDPVIKINHCGHIFKRNNIMRWFCLNSKCPVCRFDIRTTRQIPQTDLSRNTTNNINSSNDNIPISPRNLSVSPRNVSFSINETDVSGNIIDSAPIDTSGNHPFDDIRRRVTNLLTQAADISGSGGIIAADITFELPLNNDVP